MKRDFKVAEVQLSYKHKVPCEERQIVSDSQSAYQIIKPFFSDKTIDYRESFKVFYLNVAGHVLGCLTVSEGGPCSTAVDVKLILQGALLANAHSVILAHNHPSGNLQPSTSDKFMTEKVEKALSIMDMKLLDHLIVTRGGYFSFVDEGVM
jgi:DNA repair protein RadC